MTTPIDELAGIDPVRDRIFETLMTGGVWDRHLRGGHSIDASKHAAALADLLAATLDAARSTPVPASNVSEGLREADYRALLQPLIDRMNWTRAAREDPKVSARVFAANTTAFPWEHYERDIRGLLDAFARCEGETK